MAKVPKQGKGGGSDWGHRELRGQSRARGGDGHAKWNGGPKKKGCLGVLILVGATGAVLTDLVINYI